MLLAACSVRPIEMILADYQTDQRLVVEQANRLLRQEKVDLLAGTFLKRRS